MMVHRFRVFAVLATLFVSAALVMAASRTGTAPAGAQAAGFKHIIVIVQENRTPDNLFQGLCVPPFGTAASCSTTPSATQYNIKTSAWLDKAAAGGTIEPKPVPLGNTYDLNHAHRGFLAQCDAAPGTTLCKMDGRAGCAGDCLANPQFLYVDNSTGTVNPYLQLATQYGWANFMFQTNQGPSFPAHQILFGGTSAPSASDDAAGIFASENMVGTGGIGGFNKIAGCIAPSTTQVEVINPTGPPTRMYPCFEHQTMADLFTGSVTWRYYAPAPGTIWTAPNSIKHICQSTGPGGKCVGPIWTSHLDFHPPDVLADIASCNLRSVSWVIPAGAYSDHAGLHSGSGGPAWVASIVNAIGKSTSCDGGKGYWNDTAIVITWTTGAAGTTTSRRRSWRCRKATISTASAYRSSSSRRIRRAATSTTCTTNSAASCASSSTTSGFRKARYISRTAARRAISRRSSTSANPRARFKPSRRRPSPRPS
jgi:hypothetical protein